MEVVDVAEIHDYWNLDVKWDMEERNQNPLQCTQMNNFLHSGNMVAAVDSSDENSWKLGCCSWELGPRNVRGEAWDKYDSDRACSFRNAVFVSPLDLPGGDSRSFGSRIAKAFQCVTLTWWNNCVDDDFLGNSRLTNLLHKRLALSRQLLFVS